MTDKEPLEESIEGQFDWPLTRRLLGYFLPYWRPVFWSIFFMLVGTAASLAFPMITKLAIDNHLARLYQVYHPATAAQASQAAAWFQETKHPVPDAVVRLDETTLLLHSGALGKLPKEQTARLVADSALDKTKYYLFPAASCPASLEHPVLRGGYWLAPETEIRRIPVRTLFQLRGADWHGILWLAAAAFAIIVLNLVADYFHMVLLNQAGQAAMVDLRLQIFRHLEGLSVSYFTRKPMGRLVTRVTNDVGALNDLFTTVIVQFLRDILMLVGAVAILFSFDAKLALMVMATIPLFLAVTLYFKVKLRDIYRQSRRYLSSLNAHLSEDISGFKIIQVFRQGPRRLREYSKINDDYCRSMFREVKWFGVFRPAVEIICAAGMALVFVYGGMLTLGGAMQLGTFVAFIAYVDRMFKPLGAMCDKYTIMQSAMAAAERLVAILDEKPTVTEAPDAREEQPAQGRVEFDDIHFSYLPGQPVLKGVSFTVEPGRSVAIVGPTGAGKSSVISLLCRFYDPDSGTVRLDGQDVKTLPMATLRKNIAIVLQEPFIFSRSIRDNLAMGADYPDERIRQAAEMVQAAEFINGQKQGYDTEMEERGATLSAGQRQLLCFARALAHDPKILVLDEATSNIDPATEQRIQQAIATLMKSRTCVVVAHRLSTIRQADEILVLDGGRILERGSHDQLLAKRGAYYNLYLLQYQNH